MNWKNARKYIRIMRLDHWIKQLFIMPGFVFALTMTPPQPWGALVRKLALGFFATCLIASANYVINEWLDREFARFHPVKKHRSIVEKGADPRVVYGLYAVLTAGGFALAAMVGSPMVWMVVWLWVMGILYNVKPFRTKDVVFLDVLTESLNNAIRLLIGWFIVTDAYFPPVSLIFGAWCVGAFLMATKRFSEYRMINDPKTAGLYRKSFVKYTERSLMLSAFFYAMCSVLLLGIFLIKYDVDMILIMPFVIGMFCYYFRLSYQEDSAAQKPEKLIHEKGLMLYVLLLVLLFIIMTQIEIPFLTRFAMTDLVPIR